MKKHLNFKLIAAVVLLVVLTLNVQYALTGYNASDVAARDISGTTQSDVSSSAFLGVETYTECDSRYDMTYTMGQTLKFTYQLSANISNISYVGSASVGGGVVYSYVSSGSGVRQAKERTCPGYAGFCSHRDCGQF